MKSPYLGVKEAVSGKRFLTVGELEEWSEAEHKFFWAPTCEVVETDATVNLVVDLPGCGAGDIQIALMPRAIILKKKVRLLASRNWKEFCEALLGPKELLRRFDMPAVIDANRVKAELELGVLTVIAPKQAHPEQPVRGVTEKPHAVAA
jgi:HSP20 family molecular chaperone IbpA